MPNCLGFMQTSFPLTLHFKMGITATPGSAEMPNVSTAMDLRASPTAIINPKTVPNHLEKYYAQRHRLFHLYDEGIKLDEESWYSVTPEKIAAHIAERFEGKRVILDLFGGAGGNSIQFALAGAYVISVEISSEKIALAAHNADVYGVLDYIEFVQCDACDLLSSLQNRRGIIDAVFMSPPWGGPGYLMKDEFDVSEFTELVNASKLVSTDVAILLPRNVEADNILKNFGPCEIERNYLGGKLKTVTVYFGDLIARPDSFDEELDQLFPGEAESEEI